MRLLQWTWCSVLCGLAALGFAQSPELTWRANPVQSMNMETVQILPTTEGAFDLLQSRKGLNKVEYFLTRISLNDQRDEVTVPLATERAKGQTIAIRGLTLVNDTTWVIASIDNRSKRKRYVVASQIGTNGLPTGKQKRLVNLPFSGLKSPSPVKLVFDPTGHFLAAVEYQPEPNRLNSHVVQYTFFDRQLQPTGEKALELPFKGKEFILSDHVMDEKGLYWMARIQRIGDRWKQGQPNYHYSIMTYAPDRDELREYKLELKGRSVSKALFTLDTNQTLVACGFYSNIAPAVLTGLLDERQVEKGRELENFVPTQLLAVSEGRFFMVAEQKFMRRVCSTHPQTGLESCNDHYYFNDLLIAELLPEGNIAEVIPFEKKQFSANDGGPYSSVVAGWQNGQLHLLFNDHPKNETLGEGKSARYMTNPRNSQLVWLQRQQGQWKRQKLQSNESAEVILAPSVQYPIANGQWLVMGQWNRDFRFGTLTIPSAP